MAEFGADGVLRDSLTRVSTRMKRALVLNERLVRQNEKLIKDLENKKQRTLRQITMQQLVFQYKGGVHNMCLKDN